MTDKQKIALETKVENILLEFSPMIAMHGGAIKLIEINDKGVVKLDFMGACSDCELADITLNDGLKEAIMLQVPAITDVISNANA